MFCIKYVFLACTSVYFDIIRYSVQIFNTHVHIEQKLYIHTYINAVHILYIQYMYTYIYLLVGNISL